MRGLNSKRSPSFSMWVPFSVLRFLGLGVKVAHAWTQFSLPGGKQVYNGPFPLKAGHWWCVPLSDGLVEIQSLLHRHWWHSETAEPFPFTKHHTLRQAQRSVPCLPSMSLCWTVLTDFSIFKLVHLVFTHCSYVVRLIFINLHASEGKEHPAKDSIRLASSGMSPLQAANSGTSERSFPKHLYRLPNTVC